MFARAEGLVFGTVRHAFLSPMSRLVIDLAFLAFWRLCWVFVWQVFEAERNIWNAMSVGFIEMVTIEASLAQIGSRDINQTIRNDGKTFAIDKTSGEIAGEAN